MKTDLWKTAFIFYIHNLKSHKSMRKSRHNGLLVVLKLLKECHVHSTSKVAVIERVADLSNENTDLAGSNI